MERNVMGELSMHRAAGTKPNFSDIARRHGLDRHTVAKYWREGGEVEDRRSDRESAFERVRADRRGEGRPGPGRRRRGCTRCCCTCTTTRPLPGLRGVHRVVPQAGGRLRCPVAGGAPALRDAAGPPAAVRLEGGRQARRRERRGLRGSTCGRGTLGHSRRHRFIPTRTRTTDDLLACLLDAFLTFGGIPEECVTDNMSALVAFSGGRRRKVERAWRFAEEAGFRLVLCRPGTPETKGKDESANRFLSRLRAYEGEFHRLGGASSSASRA